MLQILTCSTHLDTTMKTLTALWGILLVGATFAAGAQSQPPAATDGTIHRYLVERTFPAGALAGLDTATKEKVNAKNTSVGVRWRARRHQCRARLLFGRVWLAPRHRDRRGARMHAELGQDG